MHTTICELIAFAAYFIYGSFFEWYFHRYCFHAPKLFPRMFKAHTMVHHQIYKGDDTNVVRISDHPEKVTIDWWAMPTMVLVHLPIFLGIQWVTKIPSAWGGIAAVVVYFALYESLHWIMHVPDTAPFIAKTRLFKYLAQHHKVHHQYMLSNLNVILPFADLMLGTLRDANGKRVLIIAQKKRISVPNKKNITTQTVN